jgi:alpha-tubulin suppressor-like RCC1 family protein
MPFLSQCGCIKDILVTEEELIDRFVGHELWAWGCGADGINGDNSTIRRSSPVQTISGGTDWKSISTSGIIGATFTHSRALKTDGTLWTWGPGSTGALGNNSTIARSSPVQTISGGTNWRSVSFTAAIKTDGTLWTWGAAYFGKNGDNSSITRSSPVQTISGGTNWKSVSAVARRVSAIKTDGTLWLWGRNEAGGALGDNAIINRSSPVQTISGGTNWKSVSTGGNFSSAIKTDGTLWTWGANNAGQLGVGSTIERSSPVQTISGGTNWKSVSSGYINAAAIKTDGTLWTWGSQGSDLFGIVTYGALGNNSTIPRSSPVQTISGGTNWRTVSAGTSSMAAIKTDGTLWTWGNNFYSALGNNSSIPRSSPVQTISGGTNWRSVCVGSRAVLALCVTEF